MDPDGHAPVLHRILSLYSRGTAITYIVNPAPHMTEAVLIDGNDILIQEDRFELRIDLAKIR